MARDLCLRNKLQTIKEARRLFLATLLVMEMLKSRLSVIFVSRTLQYCPPKQTGPALMHGRCRGCLPRFVKAPAFDIFFTGVVFFNSIFIGAMACSLRMVEA